MPVPHPSHSGAGGLGSTPGGPRYEAFVPSQIVQHVTLLHPSGQGFEGIFDVAILDVSDSIYHASFNSKKRQRGKEKS